MGRGEYDYIKGNTVTSPSRRIEKQNPIRRHKDTKRIAKNRRLKEKRKSDRKYLLNIAVVILCFGSLTILGDSKVYTMQQKVRALNSEIRNINEENEALKITILKYSSLKNIQDNAQSKLSMETPQKSDMIVVDCSNNYFKNVKEKEIKKDKDEKGIIDKIKYVFNMK